MTLKEFRQIASVDRVLVVFTDKYGHQVRQPILEVLPSRLSKYDEDSVARVEARLDTSSPNFDGSVQVTPCLIAVVNREE